MTDFDWTNVLELGHAKIDKQHKQLLQLCTDVTESLVNSGDPKLGAAQLQQLVDFTEQDFAFEEGLMRSVGYPALERHAKYHASLLAELRTFYDNVQRGVSTNPVGLMNFLRSWLNVHIDSVDRPFVVWLKSHEPDAGV